MARQESDREDVMREATALVERVELCAAEGACDAAHLPLHVIAGFRSSGALSLFFGSDPVYQFNAAGELRRAYCDGVLYKAARRRLASLRRERLPDAVQLMRHDLTDEQQLSFIARMQLRLSTLARDLTRGRYRVVRQVPREVAVLSRVRRWLAEHDGLPIAASPRV
jgi:hypothetical protein